MLTTRRLLIAGVAVLLGVIAWLAMAPERDALPATPVRAGARDPAQAPSAAPIAPAVPDRTEVAPPAALEAAEPAAPATGAVHGRLFDAGGRLCAYHRITFARAPSLHAGAGMGPAVSTGREGSFAVDAIATGSWFVLCRSPQSTSDVRFVVGEVEVAAGRVVNVDLFLRGSRRLAGNFTVAGFEGMALRLELLRRNNRELVALAFVHGLDPLQGKPPAVRAAASAAQRPGRFEMIAIPDGEYLLRIAPEIELPPEHADLLDVEELEIDLTDGDLEIPPRVFGLDEFGLQVNR